MLVLDANILIRAVLGFRVSGLLCKYAGQVEFVAPDAAFAEARESLPAILERRGVAAHPAMATFDRLPVLVRVVEADSYQTFEHIARQRIAKRDEDDWPVLATALTLNYPIWTEDKEFLRMRSSYLDDGSRGVVLDKRGGARASFHRATLRNLRHRADAALNALRPRIASRTSAEIVTVSARVP